jgi:apolipoprotein N-acyltransferase
VAGKKTKGSLYVKRVFLAVASGVLLALSFPNFEHEYLAWVGLVPLLCALKECRRVRDGFLAAFVAGVAFNTGVYYWSLEMPGFNFNLVDFTLINIYLASYWAFFGAILVLASTAASLPFTLTAPWVWVTGEYVRCNLSFLAFPWALLGSSQYQNLPFIQVASITGVYGVSAVLVLINAVLCDAIFTLLNAPRGKASLRGRISTKDLKKICALVSVAALTLCIVYGFGYLAIKTPIQGKRIQVATLRTYIDGAEKKTKTVQQIVRDHYISLSRAAAAHNPNMVIWPESSVPTNLRKNFGVLKDISDLQSQIGASLVVGATERSKFRKSETREGEVYNSAFVFSSEGGALDRYQKIRLFPFSEYLPLRGIFPWPSWMVPDMGPDLTAGKDYKVFSLPQGKFGIVICWENMFPDLPREFAKRQAQFIVNISNENMLKGTAAVYQILAMSVFRAVENLTFVVRSTNGGVSCFIDPRGKIIGAVGDSLTDKKFTDGFLVHNITLSEKLSFYTRYGDLFAYLSIAVTLLILAISFRARLAKKKVFGSGHAREF